MTSVEIIKDQLQIISEKNPGEIQTVLKLVRLAAEKLKPGLSEKERKRKVLDTSKNLGNRFKKFQ